MRLTLLSGLTLACVLAPGAFAQRPVNPNPIVNNANILHPGIPPAGAGTFAPRGNVRGGVRRPSGGGARSAPYPVYIDPFYFGAGAGYQGGPDPIFGGGYAPPFQGDQGYGPEPQPPTIIINQNFQTDTIHPQFRDYSNVPLPEPGVTMAPPPAPAPPAAPAPPVPPGPNAAADDDRPNLYLIALKDQSVLTAVAYWVKDDTLHYITMKGVQNQVSLDLVDRDFSRQLNAERQVQFRLPPAR
jgi:hypothetical protein